MAADCVCNESSCDPGYRCVDGDCEACNSDEFCGAACQPCAALTPYCAAGGVGCVACRNDDHCEGELVCRNGSCLADCPASVCVSNNASALFCHEARQIGRLDAVAGYHHDGRLVEFQQNDDVDNCSDRGADNYFKVYLKAGDTVEIAYDPASYDGVLKLYEGTACDGGPAGSLLRCENAGSSATERITHTATRDGWYGVVVDGRDPDDSGRYDLDLSLTRGEGNLCCPGP